MNRKQSARGLVALMVTAMLAAASLACAVTDAVSPPQATTAPTVEPTTAPTEEPTAMPVAGPDISKVGLTTGDLPGGFDKLSAGDLSDMKDNLDGYDAFAESTMAGFRSDGSDETLYVYVGLLRDEEAHGKYDNMLDNPDVVMKEIFPGSDLSEIDYKAYTDITGLGDNSAALAMATEANGTKYGIVLVGFRRGEVAVMIFYVFPAVEGGATIDLDTVLTNLDGQAQDAAR